MSPFFNQPTDLDGIVMVKSGVKELGVYVKDNVLTEDLVTSEKAFQNYYVINFVDLSSQNIIKQDTIFGPEPKKRKTKLQSQGSDFPDDDEVVAKIQEMNN